MDCSLCHKPIKDYDLRQNHIDIDEANSAELCQDCVQKIMKWQGGIYAKLFPTSAMKNRFGQVKQ